MSTEEVDDDNDGNASASESDHEIELNIHEECWKDYPFLTSQLSQFIELHPESLAKADDVGNLPLHVLLRNVSSSIEDAWMMMDKYPAALLHENYAGYLPLHIECKYQCRSAVLVKCIELYPEALERFDMSGHLPLHRLLLNESSSVEDAWLMVEAYPTALEESYHDDLPLHIECNYRCRSSIISKCIELYPEALATPGEQGDLPLHRLLQYDSSSTDDALMMIETYPEALKHRNNMNELPIHIECKNQYRLSIVSACVKLYPETFDNKVINITIGNIDKKYFQEYASLLSFIFTYRPMSLYQYDSLNGNNDIRSYPYYRRRILNDLLPHRVLTPKHDSDYRELNWQPRAAMMMLLSQMKLKNPAVAK
jgi:hypothetical protein